MKEEQLTGTPNRPGIPPALKGIRVADVSMHYAGPTCTRILADMGAEVIKVESIQRPDAGTRRLVPAENEFGDRYWERSGYYIKRNLNKYGVTLDLTKAEGADLFKKLVRISDIVVENYTPRVMKHFGLDYEVLKEEKPDVIMISLSGYGQNGPYRDRVALGPGMEAACGIASVTGYKGGPPSLSGLSYIDAMSGVTGACAVMTALVHRQRTGKGQYIDLSETESVLPSMANAIMEFSMNGRIPERLGNGNRHMAPHGCYRCKGDESWVTIAVNSEDEWKGLCRTMSNPPWASEDRFSSATNRWRHREELDRLVEDWTLGQDRFELLRNLQESGVPAGAVQNGEDLLFSRHLKERGFFQVVDHPEVGLRPYPRQFPVHCLGLREEEPKSAPMLGEDNEYVLSTLLKIPNERMAELARMGVIGTEPDRIEKVKKRSWLNTAAMERAGVIRKDPDYLRRLSAYFGQPMGERQKTPHLDELKPSSSAEEK